jgi:hypothetical protein
VDNTDALKVGGAVVGGYLLGRTKKARAVASLALWATGNRYRVRDVARDGVVRLAQSPEVSKTASELTGPLLEASRRAALAVVQAQAQRLTQDLQNRTSALTDVGESLRPDAQSEAEEQPEEEPDEQAEATADETDEDEGTEEEPEAPRPTRSTARSAPAATRRQTESGGKGTGARRTGSSGSGKSGSRTSSSRGSGSSSRRSTTSAQTRSASSRRSR